MSEHTEDAVGALRARFDASQERIAGLCSGARKKLVAGAEFTDRAMRAKPYQSLASRPASVY